MHFAGIHFAHAEAATDPGPLNYDGSPVAGYAPARPVGVGYVGVGAGEPCFVFDDPNSPGHRDSDGGCIAGNPGDPCAWAPLADGSYGNGVLDQNYDCVKKPSGGSTTPPPPKPQPQQPSTPPGGTSTPGLPGPAKEEPKKQSYLPYILGGLALGGGALALFYFGSQSSGPEPAID